MADYANPYGSVFPPLPEKETATTTHGPDITTHELSPYQLDTERTASDVLAKKIEAEQRATALRGVKADIDAATADASAKEAARQEQIRADEYAKVTKPVEEATSYLAAKRKQLEEAPTPALFGDRDTGEKVLLGLGMIFAGLGDAQKARAAALLGQQFSGPSSVMQLVNLDLQRQREKLAKMSDDQLRAETGLKDALAARTAAMAEVDLRGKMAFKRIADIGTASLKSIGRTEEQIAGDQNIQALRAEEIKRKDAVGSHLTQSIVNQGTDTTTTIRENKPGSQTKPGVEDVKETNRLDADIMKLTQTIEAIEKNPAAWNEYRQNEEDWARSEAAKGGVVGEVRKIGQAAGLFNVAPEQGLKTDDGRRVHQGMSQVKTSIAKGYGGVITDGDRSAAGSEVATLGLDAPHAVETLKRARSILENGRASFYANRGIQPATPGPGAAPAGEQSTAAGGAAHGTRDTRGDADAQPSESAPGPAVETPANSPDNVNSMEPLPESPDAGSLPEATAAPRRLPGGVESLGKKPTATEADARRGADRAELIQIYRKYPASRNPAWMRRFGITEADLR